MKGREFKSFLSEPIIQMIILHVGMIIMVASGILAAEQHARTAYYEPADREIENREARGKLAGAMVSMLKDMSVDYRRLVASENVKSAELYASQLLDTCAEVSEALNVLENGGSYTYVQLVNFYDKDTIFETISYQAPEEHDTSIYTIDIKPKLEELTGHIGQTQDLVLDTISTGDHAGSRLRLVDLQTEALLHRIKESANKVFYDIRTSNASTAAKSAHIRKRVETAVLLVNLVATLFIVGVALIISVKIFSILRTQRKTEALNRQLSTLVEQNPSAIVITDLDGAIEYVNPAFLKSTGYEREEVIGQNPRILKSDRTSDQVVKELWDTITAGNVWSDRLCNRRKDGSLFYEQVVISPVRDAAGKIINYVSVKLDVTKIVQMEEEQQRTHLSMKTIVDNLPLGVVLVNRNKRIIDLNQEAARILGCETMEAAEKMFVGHECREAFCDTEFDSCPILDLGREGVYFVEKNITLNRDIYILKSVIKINYYGEDVLMEVFLDITDRKQQEELLKAETEKSNRLMTEARAANQVKSDFLANMSHEIRTPLNSIVGMNQLLLRTDLNAQQRKNVEQTQTASRLLISIINDILDFSKIEAGKIEIEQIDIALEPFFADVKSLLTHQAEEKGIELTFTVSPQLPKAIKTDRVRLNQILLNLLGNAIKFTHKGSVELNVHPVDEAKPGTCRIHFEVRDTGIGISPDHLDSLFSPFSQADMSTTRTYGGTGLGLVISSRLTELLGGRLNVSSTVGKGSRFFFDLSLPEGTAGKTEPKRAVSTDTPDLSGKRILLVEDNEMNQEVALGLLEPTGADMALAANGLEAVQMLNAHPFDLILMDLQMPVMDGYEAMRSIRPDHPDLPIIALSAAATSDNRNRARDAGATVHVSKPIDQSELFLEIRRHLSIEETDRPARPVSQPQDKSPVCEPAGVPEELPGINMENARKHLGRTPKRLHKRLWSLRKRFRSEFGGLPQQLTESLDDDACRSLHTLKGLAGTIGATQLFELSIQLEKEIHSEAGMTQTTLLEFSKSLSEVMDSLDRVPEYKLYDAAGPKESAEVLTELADLLEKFKVPKEDLLARAASYLAQNGATPTADELIERVNAFQFQEAFELIQSHNTPQNSP